MYKQRTQNDYHNHKHSRPTKYARFTWSDDLENCQHLAINIEDEEFEAMIASKAYEGANLEGWIVEID
ncbi:MAG: hypothetical protein CM15mV149_190 [uncultured marine virus]|nr:MAG: hypothetical protein CM15mV149_190 [uncultured marine virus]